MAGKRYRKFQCEVVDEEVKIHLSSRRVGGFSGTQQPFVQCNQDECQYVDENKAPCPLRPEMFAAEIEAKKKAKEDPPVW